MIESLETGDESMQSLRRTWRRLASLAAILLLLAFGLIRSAWDPSHAAGWLGLASLAVTYQLLFLRRALKSNHRADSQTLLPSLGAGTGATFARGLLLAGAGGFLFSARPAGGLAWGAMALFTAAELLDYLDGYLARMTQHQTALGEAFDLELDGMGMLIGSGLGVWYGTLPWPFLIIGLAGYLFRFGKWVRRRAGKEVFELPVSVSRRPIAGMTMGFLSAMLWPILSPPATTLAGVFFLAPLLASFSRDWLVVSGVIDPQGAGYARARSWARAALLRWLPVPGRLILVLSLASSIVGKLTNYPREVAIFSEAGFPFAEGVVLLFSTLEGGLAVLIGLGVAGRAAAFLLVFPIGLTIVAGGLDAESGISLAGLLLILILGTGALSLWQPEDRIFTRRLGADHA